MFLSTSRYSLNILNLTRDRALRAGTGPQGRRPLYRPAVLRPPSWTPCWTPCSEAPIAFSIGVTTSLDLKYAHTLPQLTNCRDLTGPGHASQQLLPRRSSCHRGLQPRSWQFFYYADGEYGVKTRCPIPQTYRGWVPWLGVALPFFNDVHGFVADKLRRHGVDPFRYLLLGQMWVIISAPADVRAFLTSPEHELSIGSAFEGLVGFLMPKEFAFIRRHHIFVPALRSTAMQQFVTCWHQLLESELTHLWPSSEGGAGRVELFGACRKLIMRLIVRGLLGPGIFEECRYEEFCQAFEEIDPEKGLVDLMSCLLSPSKKEAAWLRVKAIVSSLIDRYERFGASSGGADLAGECTLHDMVRSAAAKGQGDDGVRCKLDVVEATGHLFAFLFTGLSSTYAVLAWCILHLTADDGLRSRVMAELLGKGDAASLDSYESVPVTRALVDEVIRTHPFGLLFRKVVPADGFALPSGRRVPQGDMLAVYVPQLSQDPELFGDDAIDFNIDRFLEPRSQHKAAGLLCVPWGAGKHPCLGARFAVVQVAMVLRALFTSFDFLPLEQLPDINQSQFATVGKPRSPVPLTFRRKPKQ